MYEYTGNIHIHTRYSDGTGTIKQIAATAARNRLDFIIITDHENLKGLQNGEEGYHYGVLTLVGMEVNDTSCHYLALGVNEVVPNNTENPQVVIDNVNRQGGMGIIAHPLEKGSPIYKDGLTFNWTHPEVERFQGIEIWNYLSQWRDGMTNILKTVFLLFYPHNALKGPYPEIMKWVDERQQKGEKVVITGGSDAHHQVIKLGLVPITIGPYDYSFKCINMHILSAMGLQGNLKTDKQLIYDALRTGHSWVGYDYFKNSRGFAFHAYSNGQRCTMGEIITGSKDTYLEAQTPYPALVKLIHNGTAVSQSRGRKHRFAGIKPGNYRIEAYHHHLFGYRPWIFTNSIRIK